MKTFNTLTKADVEKLKKKPIFVKYSGRGVTYNFTESELDDAVKHLKTLYTGIVRTTFAAKILLLNEIY